MIVITGQGDIEMAVNAMKNGAHDFMSKPIQFERLEQSIQRATEIILMRRELMYFRESNRSDIKFVVGSTPDMEMVMKQAKLASESSVSVLITGETGTGKEVLARFIHQQGPRKGKRFMDINMAAIQPTVAESELFGYEAGAFTGAEKKKNGLLHEADDGILFMDEISSMPMDMQVKLLSALENKSFRRVGGIADIKVDVQVIAASNRDLGKMMKEGTFRDDLYYRLKVINIDLPPLRERKADIPELVGFYINKFNRERGRNVNNVSPKAMEALMKYSFPGNIRELRNAMERAILFCNGETIELNDLSADIILNKPL
jgi:DNA-binding NtrC family response regulator